MDIERSLSPQESLALIADAISKTRDHIRQNSFGFLLWGWLLTIASFAFFILQHYGHVSYYFLPFPVLVTVGIITTIIFVKRQQQTVTQTYADYFLNKMWMVLGISFIAVVFINVSQGKVPFTYTLLIAAIGTMISGMVLKFRPLIIGGILFLAASIASLYIADDYKSLLHGFAIIAGYLVPGYLLKKSRV